MTKIGIINYGMGNLRSVQKALERQGGEAVILDSPQAIESVGKLVLPGVGAFADGMEHLREGGWVEPIGRWVESGRPFLGICLGMQLLFESSQEDALSPDAPVPGLGVLPGRVVGFDPNRGGQRIKVPHMGWNALRWERPDPLLAELNPGDAVYFVHGYYVEPREDAAAPLTSATCDYAGPFCASVWRDRVWATQFHPEKSQAVGLTILANFVAVN